MTGYILGIDAGTESFRSGVFDETGRCLGVGVSENTTVHRHPGWAEQSPRDWDRALVESIRGAIAASKVDPDDIHGIGIDGTSCTPVFLDSRGRQLRDAVMWMDIRSLKEAEDIAATGDPALRYVGHGNVSPEWFPCKVLWVKRNEPQIYSEAATIFEQTDWMAYRLTGRITANIDTTTIRWFYNRPLGGLPESLYRAVGLEDVFPKLPRDVVDIGEVVGGLTREMAELTSLKAGIPVAGGGADAYIGVIGMNALQPGTLALITGSSHLHIGITDREIHAQGLFGSFPDALIPGLQVIEAGQISTGSVVRWFASNFINREIAAEAETAKRPLYAVLDEKAARLPQGSEGLVVLEHWQGNRTPWTDPWSRGVVRGLTLSHTPVHVYRAILEGVACGTEVIFQKMEEKGVRVERIIACGGATKSDLWMQIHADVCGRPIVIPEEQQAVTLGSAIAASVAAGMYGDLQKAASAMVRIRKEIRPDREAHERYTGLVRQYVGTYESLKDSSRRLVESL